MRQVDKEMLDQVDAFNKALDGKGKADCFVMVDGKKTPAEIISPAWVDCENNKPRVVVGVNVHGMDPARYTLDAVTFPEPEPTEEPAKIETVEQAAEAEQSGDVTVDEEVAKSLIDGFLEGMDEAKKTQNRSIEVSEKIAEAFQSIAESLKIIAKTSA